MGKYHIVWSHLNNLFVILCTWKCLWLQNRPLIDLKSFQTTWHFIQMESSSPLCTFIHLHYCSVRAIVWNSFDTTWIFWDFMFFIHQTVNWVDVCAGLKYLRDLPIHFINTNVNCEVDWFHHPLSRNHLQCGKSFDVCLTSFSFLIWTLIL